MLIFANFICKAKRCDFKCACYSCSTPPTSTKRVLHEHLLFSRRFRRDGVVVIPTTRKSGQGFKPWPLFFAYPHCDHQKQLRFLLPMLSLSLISVENNILDNQLFNSRNQIFHKVKINFAVLLRELNPLVLYRVPSPQLVFV